MAKLILKLLREIKILNKALEMMERDAGNDLVTSYHKEKYIRDARMSLYGDKRAFEEYKAWDSEENI